MTEVNSVRITIKQLLKSLLRWRHSLGLIYIICLDNHVYDILRLFGGCPKFHFTTSEAKRDY